MVYVMGWFQAVKLLENSDAIVRDCYGMETSTSIIILKEVVSFFFLLFFLSFFFLHVINTSKGVYVSLDHLGQQKCKLKKKSG